ncbi:MAG: zinc-binding dehydrogenase [Tannerellaceae bacterium]|jgi:NADPH:quinone reductase-like Zn-dependent oxidoreductase|nr:zinc-binding dehydrogenase [Tannerellaceae bacterium]
MYNLFPDASLLKKMFESGEYKVTIDKIFTIDEIIDAHKYVETGHKKGNVVITVT